MPPSEIPLHRRLSRRLAGLLFVRGPHVCPWWFCHAFDNPLRKAFQDPAAVVSPWVRPGDRVLDIGAGMGFFTIPLARAAGEEGRVVAVDLQPQMLERIAKRAAKAGVRERIETVISEGGSLGVGGPFDFALAMWMVHEVSDQRAFLAGVARVLKPGGRLLVAEPKLHVSRDSFERMVGASRAAGFTVDSRPRVPLSHAVLLQADRAPKEVLHAP